MQNQIEQYNLKIYNFKKQINLSQEDKLILLKQNDFIKESLRTYLESINKTAAKVMDLLDIDITKKNEKLKDLETYLIERDKLDVTDLNDDTDISGILKCDNKQFNFEEEGITFLYL